MRKLLKEIIPKNNGIFYYLNSYTEDIWGYITTDNLDFKFYHMFGNRIANSMMIDLSENYDWRDSAEIIAQMCIQEYSYKWRTLFSTTMLNYNPISDYQNEFIRNTRGSANSTDTESGGVSNVEDRSTFSKIKTTSGAISDRKNGTVSVEESGADTTLRFPEHKEHSVTDDYTEGNFKNEKKTTGTVLTYNDNDSNLQHENQTLQQIWAFNSSSNPVSVSKSHEDVRKITDYGSNDVGENIKPYTVTETPSGKHTQITKDDTSYDPNGSNKDKYETVDYGKQVETVYNGVTDTRNFNDLKDIETYSGNISDTKTYNLTNTKNQSSSGSLNDNESGLHRHTNQELINQERDISYFQFFDIVMRDIANLISLKIY